MTELLASQNVLPPQEIITLSVNEISGVAVEMNSENSISVTT